MYYCEGWITKKVEHQITYFFLNYGKVKTFESPLDYKEIIPASPKGNPPWIFFGRTDAEAEDPILWPSDIKIQLIGKDPDSGKDWRQKEKGVAGY